MTEILTKVLLEPTSGVPADTCVNTFVFSTPGPADAAAGGAIATLLDEFYAAPIGAGTVSKVGGMISNHIDRSCPVKCYDITAHLDGSPAGAPFYAGNLNLPAAHYAANFPHEVALCLSYKFGQAYSEDIEAGPPGPVGNIHPAARHRGRIFIGPLCYGADMIVDDGKEVRPSGMALDVLRGAGERLSDRVAVGAVNVSWSLWSRTQALVFDVQAGWADNSFDTQRRRGSKPTTRWSWT